MRKVNINESTVKEIQALFNNFPNISKKEICKKFGFSYDVLRRVIEEYDIDTNRDDYEINLSPQQLEMLQCLFENDEIQLQDISRKLKCSYSVMLKAIRGMYGSEALEVRKSKLYSVSKSGSNNPQSLLKREFSNKWKGGKPDDGNGYSLVFNDGWIEEKSYDGYVFEHQLVMLKALNLHRMPNKGIIHHINHNRKDNSINNLALMTNGAHSRLHSLERIKKLSKTNNEIISLSKFLNWAGIENLPAEFTLFYIDKDSNNWQFNNLAILTQAACNLLNSMLYTEEV